MRVWRWVPFSLFALALYAAWIESVVLAVVVLAAMVAVVWWDE